MIVLCPPDAILKAFLLVVRRQIDRESPSHVLIFILLYHLLPYFEFGFHEGVLLQVDVEQLAGRHDLDAIA